VQQVIDLCIRIGEVLLSSGEGSGETTETMLRVANAFGLSAVDVDITFTAVTICCHRGMAATPITSMRLVTHRGLDLTLLARVYRLVEQIERRPAPRGWRERLHCCWAHRSSRCSRPPASPRSSTSPGGSWPGSGCLRSSGR
jgi:hypothetical protein